MGGRYRAKLVNACIWKTSIDWNDSRAFRREMFKTDHKTDAAFLRFVILDWMRLKGVTLCR